MATLKDMKIDPVTNDLVIENGDIQFVEDIDALLQRLRIKFQTFLGEFFPDINIGLPYLKEDDEGRQILGKEVDPADVEDIFKDKILETNGIVSLRKFRFELDSLTRVATLEFEAESTFGTVKFSEELI